ncbi:Glycine cleavage system T protein [Rosistilla carotiformis]|uniref:aminomethyltransferase n=1 Tax=Rosistilla carotiformis TaxID=2528017 RepID=A0A518K1I5_9BACT|nr:glycine cleavage system aminomethyltransferase GcvT [Rosistilla carotiformis]QDV71632.1 Glycine cleavage system T protein [Rosistilla carotiformis]
MTDNIASTPLTSWHRAAGATMSPFAGFDMPIHYGSIVAEHHACRNAATLFDVSHMGRIRFDGDRSAELLDRLLTRRVSDLAPGGIRYSLMCNEEGGILDDVLVYHIEKPSGGRFHMLVVNASNRQKIIEWLTPRMADYPDVICTDRTELTSMIALQGPLAMATVEGLFKHPADKLGYYHSYVTEQFNKPVIVSRTGYTGEDGLELITRADEAGRIWENLMLAGRKHGIQAAGLGCRDTLRLEAAMPLYGHELSESIDPISAGLGFACNFKDRTFIGSEALVKIKADQPQSVRVGIRVEGVRPAREGCQILDANDQNIGAITSGTVSPTLQYPIAMGYVAAEHSQIGSPLTIDIRGKRAAANVVPLPFYKRNR